MAINLIQLSAALRVGDGVAVPEEPLLSILTRLLAVASAYVDLVGPDAPTAIQDEAVVRFAGYLYDAPSASGSNRFASAWTNSGAGALVSRWVQQRVAATIARP